jgi:hypothetical protein
MRCCHINEYSYRARLKIRRRSAHKDDGKISSHEEEVSFQLYEHESVNLPAPVCVVHETPAYLRGLIIDIET